jgi:hypothetical protein
MTETTKSLLNLVNAAGYLLQLRIEHEVETNEKLKGDLVKVICREHRWLDPITGTENFIDLVLGHYRARFVLGYCPSFSVIDFVKQGEHGFDL